jgi:hypothetical protein
MCALPDRSPRALANWYRQSCLLVFPVCKQGFLTVLLEAVPEPRAKVEAQFALAHYHDRRTSASITLSLHLENDPSL